MQSQPAPGRPAPDANRPARGGERHATFSRQEHIEQDTGSRRRPRQPAPLAAPEKPLAGADEVRQPFVDSHDTQDAATLFDRDTKGTMKDALAAMWDGGKRSCGRPVRQMHSRPSTARWTSSRTSSKARGRMCRHVGFEPAPLKIAERRLQGDATGAPALASDQDTLPPSDPALVNVRAALAAVSWNDPPVRWLPETLDALRRAEPALTAAATRRPEVFLDGLQVLRRLLSGDFPTAPDALRPLEQALLRRLPPVSSLTDRALEPAPALSNAYFKALGAGEAKP